jgi:hypothetical protein
MKYIFNFISFNEEVNPKDIFFIQSNFDEYFTISFEFELETDDSENYQYDFEEIDDDLLDDVFKDVKKELKLSKRKDTIFLKNLLNSILDLVDTNKLDYKLFNYTFDSLITTDENQNKIVEHTKLILLSQIISNDFEYLTSMSKIHLKSFLDKWGNDIDFISDASLDRGIEIKPKTYIISISKGIEMIEDFYSTISNQSYWKFAPTTGLHINIGTINDNIEWNPLKGLLIMDDFSFDKSRVPLVFKDMTWRQNNKFCGSLLESIYKMSSKEKLILKNKFNINDIKKTENDINSFLTNKVKVDGLKNFGFNIIRIEQNYVEFRYVGGDISKETLIDKLKYFSFLVFCMTNKEYKRKEYLKKLYKFINSL